MTPSAGNRRGLAIRSALVVASAGWCLWPGPAAAQIDAGLQARLRDREITVNYDTSANRTEAALAVVPSGTGGEATGVTLIFIGQFAGRAPAAETPTLSVRAHITPRSDPRVLDPRARPNGMELIFRLDPGTSGGISLYVFGTNWGYGGFAAPGDEIPVAFFTLTDADLRALSVARAITGRALSSEFILAPDQIEALREFARIVLPAVTE